MPDQTQPTTVEAANSAAAQAAKNIQEAREKKIAEAKEARAKRQTQIDELRKSVGKTFPVSETVQGKVVDFVADKLLGQKISDAYLINLGNPHRFDFIFCDDFSNKYKLNQ